MATIALPPHEGTGPKRYTYIPALSWLYYVFSLLGVVGMFGFIALVLLPAQTTRVVVDWLPMSVPQLGAIGFTSVALLFSLVSVDWLLVSHRIRNRWPRARAKVTSVQIDKVEDDGWFYVPKVRGTLLDDPLLKERNLILDVHPRWNTEEEARASLTCRITEGECEVAVQPGEAGRLFVLPWTTPLGSCIGMAALSWGMVLAFAAADIIRFTSR
jgi:hypothetical protein